MTKDKAVHIVVEGITYGDYKGKKFVEALKMLSGDEIEKVYLAIKKRYEFKRRSLLCSIRQ